MTLGDRPSRMGAQEFERIYAGNGDPWGYEESSYEHEKYRCTLAALPGRLGEVLEVGCSIGVFTEQLARRSQRVLAIDFSARALELARPRLASCTNIELLEASFPEQLPQRQWDFVICSEILYYLDGPALDSALDWLELELSAGGCLLAVSWRGVGACEPLRGDYVHDLLGKRFARWHVLDGGCPGYRLDRFDGNGR